VIQFKHEGDRRAKTCDALGCEQEASHLISHRYISHRYVKEDRAVLVSICCEHSISAFKALADHYEEAS
jgi:hypothetical protein